MLAVPRQHWNILRWKAAVRLLVGKSGNINPAKYWSKKESESTGTWACDMVWWEPEWWSWKWGTEQWSLLSTAGQAFMGPHHNSILGLAPPAWPGCHLCSLLAPWYLQVSHRSGCTVPFVTVLSQAGASESLGAKIGVISRKLLHPVTVWKSEKWEENLHI